MKYITLYSPEGEKLEVAEPRAIALYQVGWTKDKPEETINAPEAAGNGVDALVDSQVQSNSAPVEETVTDTDAGPVDEDTNLNYVDQIPVEPIEADPAPRKRKRFGKSED